MQVISVDLLDIIIMLSNADYLTQACGPFSIYFSCHLLIENARVSHFYPQNVNVTAANLTKPIVEHAGTIKCIYKKMLLQLVGLNL